MFQDRSATAETLEEIFPDDEYRDATFVTRKALSGKVQCGPVASNANTNTPRFVQQTRHMTHVEGGWPDSVDCTDPEQTARFRKRVEKEEEYVAAVKTMACNVEHTLRQNSAIDIYEEYFSGLQEEHTTDPPSAKNLTAFKDPQNVKRTVTSISWNPDGARKFACAYSNLQFQQAPNDMSVLVRLGY
jgi:dynein intermediate chain 2